MEKDIEILEDYIEALRKPKPFKYTNEQKAQVIENLINRVKELEDNYISKDKIKEKIEELEEGYIEEVGLDIDAMSNNQFIIDCVAILEELLEE